MTPKYVLTRSGTDAVVPRLDQDQQRVVDHVGGPLLVLAGPGTGKTTTLVEAIVDRIERRGADPGSVLALTFSRKAAEQLRDRVTARLGRTLVSPIAATFHSFAYGLVRQFASPEVYSAPLRLLSAPEADVMIRELLDEHEGSVRWPEELRTAAGTRGFAREVATVLARAREKGADHEQLIAIGREQRIPEFEAAGIFLEHYLDNLDFQAATDYPDLIRRAVIEAERHRDRLRQRLQHVFVDEYQDTDPGQVALLQALAGDGRDLTVVGDPHQSIYGFRGAEVRGILDFPDVFRTPAGDRAPVVVLGTTRRFGPNLLKATSEVASRLPLSGGIGADAIQQFAHPQAAEDVEPGEVEVFTFDTDRAEAEHIADILRRAHLEQGVPWSRMAVLARSGRSTLPGLRRQLAAAGVPVDVASDETPLGLEPGCRPLLLALSIVVDREGTALTAQTAEELLLSPLGNLDATDIRALGRVLRQHDQALAAVEGRAAAASGDLLARALVDAELRAVVESSSGPTSAARQGLRAVADHLDQARERLRVGASAEEVLWQLWAGSGRAERLRSLVERGGAAARRAHRDLDAVGALFDMAARAEEGRGHTSAESFLAQVAAQQIPGDTLADKGIRGEAVQLLTAHRSKGLEWDLVVVAHVQDGSWPDVRRRATLLGADRLRAERYGALSVVEDVTSRQLLAEERRLFYVACTRARRRLVVTAVASLADDGEVASRFLEELGVEPQHRQGRPPRPLHLSGLVAELRRTAADQQASPGLRQAAAKRLAALAETEVDGRPIASAADPDHWWGVSGRSVAQQPVRPADEPLRLSASTVSDVAECPARWFLSREAGGSSYSGQAAALGSLVHKLAEYVASGELAEASVEDLMVHVDQVWSQLPFRTPWSRTKEHLEARRAITRFLQHHRRVGAREVIGTELSFKLEHVLPDGQRLMLRGFADRVELQGPGEIVVIDLKTGKSHPREMDLPGHPQLALYQLAVNRGAVQQLAGEEARSVGAELWQLRTGKADGPLKVQRQEPQRVDEDGWLPIERQLAHTAEVIRSEKFPATPSDKVCRFCDFRALCPAQSTPGVIQ